MDHLQMDWSDVKQKQTQSKNLFSGSAVAAGVVAASGITTSSISILLTLFVLLRPSDFAPESLGNIYLC